MKKNFPVTEHELPVPEGIRLVSRSDTKGVITFVNDNFVARCGFSREELVGSSHNIVRHPDVPPAVFEDMWETLKKGLPWRGVVKNRCKSGDHYWVDAHVVPVKKDGETIGYMSVRTRPTREQIAQAEAQYAEAARTGRLPRPSGGGWRRFLSVRNGAVLGIVFVALMMIAGGILGVTGLRLSSAAMRALYFEQMAPVQAIGRINFLMADNHAQVALALREHGEDVSTARIVTHMAALATNKQEIDKLWQGYHRLVRGSPERELADQAWAARNRYVESGLLPARQALERGDFQQADKIMNDRINPLYDDANRRVADLLSFLSDKAQRNFMGVAARNELICIVAVAGITAGCLIVLFAGIYLFRATVMPLQSAVAALERIGEGNLSDECTTSGYGETGRVMTGVMMMQLHLKVMMDEIHQSSSSIRTQCQHLNSTMMHLAQHSDAHAMHRAVDADKPSREGSEQPEEAEAMMQRAWAASQQLQQTANELDELVKYFD